MDLFDKWNLSVGTTVLKKTLKSSYDDVAHRVKTFVPTYPDMWTNRTKDKHIQQLERKVKQKMKETAYMMDPTFGEVVEKADRLMYTIANGVEAIHKLPYSLLKCAPGYARHKLGAHLKVDRPFYSHHALYIGDQQVIHYRDGEIRVEPIHMFHRNASYDEVKSPALYDGDEIVLRAFSRLGEVNYHLAVNNCEHFVLWCRGGSEYFEHV